MRIELAENGYNPETDYLYDWVDMYKGMSFAAKMGAKLLKITRGLRIYETPDYKRIYIKR